MVKSTYAESNSSAGAGTISVIATTRGWRLAVMLLRVDNRARLSQLSAAKSKIQEGNV